MPQPEIEALTGSSSKGQKQAAISECIRRKIHAGKSQEQAQAMCYSMAEKRMGADNA